MIQSLWVSISDLTMCFGVGWQHHEDSTTSLSACIPYRLYGDGAEAQRISSEVTSYCFKIAFSDIHHWKLNVKGSRSSKCSQCSFPDARPRPPLTAELCTMAASAKRIAGNELFDVSVFLFPYLVGSSKCALRLSVMNATYAKHAARTKILEVLAWSCNALGPSLQLLFFV